MRVSKILLLGLVVAASCSEDPSGSERSDAFVTQTGALTPAGAAAFIEATYAPFVDACCSACTPRYVSELQLWDATEQAFGVWKADKRALRAKMLELMSREAFVILKTLAAEGIPKKVANNLAKLLIDAPRELSEFAPAVLVASELIKGGFKLAAATLTHVGDDDVDPRKLLDAGTNELISGTTQLQAVRTAAMTLGPKAAKKVEHWIGVVMAVVDGTIEAIDVFNEAFAEIAPLWAQVDDAKRRMDEVGAQYKHARDELSDCCSSRCQACDPAQVVGHLLAVASAQPIGYYTGAPLWLRLTRDAGAGTSKECFFHSSIPCAACSGVYNHTTVTPEGNHVLDCIDEQAFSEDCLPDDEPYGLHALLSPRVRVQGFPGQADACIQTLNSVYLPDYVLITVAPEVGAHPKISWNFAVNDTLNIEASDWISHNSSCTSDEIVRDPDLHDSGF